MKRALLIGGLDPSAGAGLLVDAFVASRLGFSPMCAATVITAQNSHRFYASAPVEPGMLRDQLRAISEDSTIACTKIGVLGSHENAETIRRFLQEHETGPVVLDPVLKSSSGGSLLNCEPEKLQPLMSACDLITPNASEAAILSSLSSLSSREITTLRDTESVALELSAKYGTSVLVTGVKQGEFAADVLAAQGSVESLLHPLIAEAGDPRGTGCAFSTAIAINLGLSKDLATAVRAAQDLLLELVSQAADSGRSRRQFDFTAGHTPG